MSILEFLELLQMQYEKFSKEKLRLIAKWSLWEPSFKITGIGKDARVSADSYDVFYFYKHAKTVWNIDENINYRILYEIYKMIIKADGRYMKPYMSIAIEFGVHPNTVSKYIKTLEAANIVSRQIIYESSNRKRVKVLPVFHAGFKSSLLKSIQEEIDWYNHEF